MKKNPLQEIINRIVWQKMDAIIEYLDRGEHPGVKRINPDDIMKAGTSFIILKDGTMIPYHRVLLVEYGGKVLYRKGNNDKKWTLKNTS